MEKYSEKFAHLRGGAVQYSMVTSTTKSWEAPCNLPEENSVFATNAMHDSALPNLATRVHSNYIRYTNSEYKSFNPCVHIRKNISSTPGTFVFTDVFESDTGYMPPPVYAECADSHPHRTVYRSKERLQVRLPQAVVGNLIEDPFTDDYLESSELLIPKLSVLDRIAMDTMLPQLDTGFSLPVFLFELTDLRKLIAGLNPHRWVRDLRELANRPLREISRHFLATVFGWLPFIDDVKTIISKLFNLRQNIDRYLENADKRQTLHFRKALAPTTFRDLAWFEEFGHEYGRFVHESFGSSSITDLDGETPILDLLAFDSYSSREVADVVYHATMDFRYSIPDVGDIAKLLAGLDSFGVNLSVSDVWEVVPFSFLVDYFVNVGGSLRRFDNLNLPAHVEILDFCRSVKYRHTFKETFVATEVNILDSSANLLESWSSPQSSSETLVVSNCYFRWAGSPLPGPDLPLFRTPRGMQVVIIGALLSTYS